jgi:SAM-dependent methyltransferase
MVTACGRRFAGLPRQPSLAVMDARDLGGLGAAAFDLVLFSFNGIDYVDHGDRLRIWREIHRVLKPGGRLVFSSHNLYSLRRTLDLRSQLSWNPLKTYENSLMWGLTRLCNRSLTGDRIAAADHLIVRDESHNFRLLTYYVRPEAQIEQLAFGFSAVEVYPWSQTTPLDRAADWSQTTDAWLYYDCVAGDRP